MRLGIDFGTTRTVVACCDRGNYPVVSFFDGAGDPIDWYPSVVAERAGELRFGFDALDVAADPEWVVLRSFKRLLSGPNRAPDRLVTIGSTSLPIFELLTRFLVALKEALIHRSNRPTPEKGDESMIAVVATPANAHGTQRFVTLDAFRRAGFEVTALLNEPSAAGFEYTHRYRSTLTSRREHIIVYDLGGGTFDASLVRLSGRKHDVVTASGLSHVGGDDFDAALVDVVLAASELHRYDLPQRAIDSLGEHCRHAKEHLNPSSRRIVIDLQAALGDLAPMPEVTVGTTEFYDACTPLVDGTIGAMGRVTSHLDRNGDDPLAELAGIYVVGGASALPVVGRVLREHYGRRVHRSAYPSASIAMGLAIAADTDASFEISDRLSRHFGVFREAAGGSDVVFDSILDRETRIPSAGAAEVRFSRTYRAAHNVGRYRFVECAMLNRSGIPEGDITAYGDIFFPFDNGLRGTNADLASVPVRRIEGRGPLIRENYAVTAHGIVEVTIADLETGYRRTYPMGA